VLTFSATSAAAQASDYVIDLRAGAGIASNPFLLPEGKAAGFLNFELLPEWRLSTERAITVLRGRLGADAYPGGTGYEPQLGLSAILQRNERLTERLSYEASLELESSRGNGIGLASISPGADPVAGGDIEVPFGTTVIPDPDLLVGNDEQRHSVRAAAAVRYRMSEIDNIEAGGGFIRSVYPGSTIFNDFNSIELRAVYDRAVNERTSAGARLSTQSINMKGSMGSFHVVNPQLTGRYRLSEIWTIEGAAGLLFVSYEQGIAPTGSTATASGELRLCRRSPTASFCASMLRDATSSGSSGVVQRTTFDAYYTRTIDRNTNIKGRAIVGSFEDVVSGAAPAALGDRQYRAITGAVERRLGSRVIGFVSGVAESSHSEALGSATNLRFQIGVSYRLKGSNSGQPFRSDQ
jgi:hypothetical protein